jgi:hypothetical protein
MRKGHSMSTFKNTIKSLSERLENRLSTPKKNVRYLEAGREQEQYKKYKHNWLLIKAGAFGVAWIVGLTRHVGKGYINLLLLIAVGTFLYAMLYTFKQFNMKHHLV